jgi:hypothetical protein
MKSVLCGLIVLFSPALAVAATTAEIVAAAYPSQLSEIASQHHYTEQRGQAYATMSVSGTSYIVAAYTNGHVAAVALIDGSANPPVTKQVIRDHQTGVEPSVTAVDLDADGTPEAVVTFTLGPRGGAETWVYRIQEGQLVSIGPSDAQGHSLLGDPDILDFDGAGIMDLVNSVNIGESRVEPVIVKEHYALQKGRYVALQPLDFYEIFYRAKAAPVADNETFSVPSDALQKPYRLTVINGGFNGPAYRISAGSVALNGVTLTGPSDFGRQRSSWSVPVTLHANNTLAVFIDGQPKSRIIVAVRHD